MTGESADCVLVLGSSGLLGTTLVPLLVAGGHHVATHGRIGESQYQARLDDRHAASELLDRIRPAVIVNLAGLTDVERCQSAPNEAFRANVLVVEHISHWMRSFGNECHLVHISTDQVYDGDGPHSEEAVTLTNVYALSKYAGELAAAAVPVTVLRTNFFGRSRRPGRASLTDWIFASLSKGENIQVFEDILVSPLSMRSLSEMIELTIRRKPPGVFNVGSQTGLSKADLAFAFAGELGLPTETMSRIQASQWGSPRTYRPKDMRMAVAKFERATGAQLPAIRHEITRAASDYRDVA